jgi:hypothetical protein
MRRTTSIALTFTAGAAFGIAFVLSCSGDNHSVADAACNCPPSEPPLTGRIVTQVSSIITIAPGAVDSAAVACIDGAQLISVISGSCTTAILNDPNAANLVLIESGFFDKPPTLPHGWTCFFKNNGATPVDVKATAICLKPSP